MNALKASYFYILFGVLVVIETIIANLNGFENLHFVSKPLIVGALLFYFISNSKQMNLSLRNFTILALVFSLLGDMLLLFVFKSELFFISGLIAFLIAYIMYCIVFFKQRDKSKTPYVFISLLIAYGIGLFLVLKPGLKNLLIPVIIYMIVILTMATLAFLRKKPSNGLNFVFLGALSFMVSDSLLALNKFYTTIPFEGFCIMFTYALAQFLIVIGLLKTINERQ